MYNGLSRWGQDKLGDRIKLGMRMAVPAEVMDELRRRAAAQVRSRREIERVLRGRPRRGDDAVGAGLGIILNSYRAVELSRKYPRVKKVWFVFVKAAEDGR